MSSQKSRADVSLSIECVPSQVARVLALAAHGVASRAPLPLVTAVETAAHRRTSSHYELFKTASHRRASRLQPVADGRARVRRADQRVRGARRDVISDERMTSSLRRRCAFEEMLSSDEQRDAYDRLGEDAARADREPDRARLCTETPRSARCGPSSRSRSPTPTPPDVSARVARLATLIKIKIR